LERDQPASQEVVTHIDRCLSCLACMTTCPSGVHYMHLVDHARAHIERTFERPMPDRLLRTLLAWLLPNPALFRLALVMALLAHPGAPLVGRGGLTSLAAMLRLAPAHRRLREPRGSASSAIQAVRRDGWASGQRAATRKVALLTGCVASVLSPQIN